MNRDENSSDVVSHSLLPPPPPPPPPPLSSFPPLLSKNLFQTVHSHLSSDYAEDEVVSLENAIARVTCAERFLHSKPFYTHFTHLQSQLQKGPKCGLVALSIATSKTSNFKSADDLYREALSKGYTSQGEIYSCENLADLIESTTDFKTHVICNGVNSHVDCLFQCLMNGGLCLISYDADRNHSPCSRRGHSAHWAVINGIIVFQEKSEEEGIQSEKEDMDAVVVDSHLFGEPCNCMEIDRKQFFMKSENRSGALKIIRTRDGALLLKDGREAKNAKKGRIYLAGLHGKSRRLALWPFESLADSNNNLRELSEQQKARKFILPRGGIAEGLMGKAILINRRFSSN